MSDEDLIIEAEMRRHAALVAVDIPALEALFCDDLVHVHSNAMVHDKAELLEYIARNRSFRKIERGALNVRINGDLAIMTGTMKNDMQRPDGTEVVLHGFLTQVLRKEAGRWRFASFHFTLFPG